MKKKIVFAKGDGIGPEIMDATLNIITQAGALVDLKEIVIGEKVYNQGIKTGIAPDTWDTIRSSDAFLKAPITTPQGGGFKSLNVTIRTTLGLYANIRPCTSYAPFVSTKHPSMDVVVVRENEEDLYTGIEYRLSHDTFQGLKIITRPASEKIIRYAFEYAKAYGRKKVTCFTKDNILKMSDGLFSKVFQEIAQEYPDIENEHWIINIGAAKLAATPEIFDVIVTPNLYGDILSDIAAQITGSVGLAGSANIGQSAAMFEAIHGSAPKHAGQNSANPSGLLLGAIMMLVHIGQPEVAASVQNAWLKTLEDGMHTYDIFKEGISKQKLGTKEFAKAVIDRLGEKPSKLKAVDYTRSPKVSFHKPKGQRSKKVSVGVDIFIDQVCSVKEIHEQLKSLSLDALELTLIANRGVGVWPIGHPETSLSDVWRCRFLAKDRSKEVESGDILNLLQELVKADLSSVQATRLFSFDGKPGYTLAQEEQ